MNIEIKSRYTSEVLFSGEYESLRDAVVAAIKARAILYGANLSGANLSRADLSGAILSGAILYGANLSRANLYDANLYGANLSGADLSRADLSRANLYGADLSGAILYGANLYGANLYGANLYGANLSGANLSGANLSGANLYGAKSIPQVTLDTTLITPEGSLIVFKAIREGIAKLLIPAEAKRHNATGRKCRAEFAVVLELPEGVTVGYSKRDRTFEYRVGETVRPTNGFGEDRFEECAPGIHFFLTRGEAERY